MNKKRAALSRPAKMNHQKRKTTPFPNGEPEGKGASTMTKDRGACEHGEREPKRKRGIGKPLQTESRVNPEDAIVGPFVVRKQSEWSS